MCILRKSITGSGIEILFDNDADTNSPQSMLFSNGVFNLMGNLVIPNPTNVLILTSPNKTKYLL